MKDTRPALPQQSDTEAQVVAMWLHGRAARTVALYSDVYRRFAAHGKGGKKRSVRLYNGAWKRLTALRGDAPASAPVIASRKGGRPVSAVQVHRIVRAASVRANIEARVSAHWLRHAHASHALDRGAPARLVRDTLGHANVATTSAYGHARPDQSSSRYLAS